MAMVITIRRHPQLMFLNASQDQTLNRRALNTARDVASDILICKPEMPAAPWPAAPWPAHIACKALLTNIQSVFM